MILEAGRPEQGAPGLLSAEAPLLGLQVDIFSLCPHLPSEHGHLWGLSLFLEGQQSSWIRAHPHGLIFA